LAVVGSLVVLAGLVLLVVGAVAEGVRLGLQDGDRDH
ncbi:MAG: hypothetical protein JWR42_2941, partial [Marmoricola sp.]|nr:hypothetical protein [Marmoricola sp.]